MCVGKGRRERKLSEYVHHVHVVGNSALPNA